MTEDPTRWSQPFTALLGAFDAQLKFGVASIGGKDSMSGSFNEINVPPTLVSFAVDIAKLSDVITPELKAAGNSLVQFKIARDQYDLPDYDRVIKLYRQIGELMSKGAIVSAYAEDSYGIAAAVSKMAFGNGLGVKISDDLEAKDLFTNDIADIIAEVPAACLEEVLKTEGARLIGTVTDKAAFEACGEVITVKDALAAWKSKLEKVFPSKVTDSDEKVETKLFDIDKVYVCRHKVAKPTVFIPVFPGSNCEYDSAEAFRRAGADVNVRVFRNRDEKDITESVKEFKQAIANAQIIMFPGGFSAGDEPDGSAKFFATAFQNEEIKAAVEDLLDNRDGLALGICNGFQAMIKLGLVPYGKITGQTQDSPTLTYNTIGRHISKMATIKVVSNNSPWLTGAKLGGVYTNPASHGEGRFVAPEKVLDELFANGQIATQYCDLDGNITMDDEWNINGSYRAVEGILSPDGRCLGKMAHSERRGDGVAVNIFGEQDLKIFESGVQYFK
jgi:phosphoribosylformylglycinamidine synthase